MRNDRAMRLGGVSPMRRAKCTPRCRLCHLDGSVASAAEDTAPAAPAEPASPSCLPCGNILAASRVSSSSGPSVHGVTDARDVPADAPTAQAPTWRGAGTGIPGQPVRDGACGSRATASAADDLVQETYLKAVRFADRFEPGTNLRAGCSPSCTTRSGTTRRDAGRDPVDVDSEVVDLAADTRAGHGVARGPAAAATSLGADLKAALDALPEAFRQACGCGTSRSSPTPRLRRCWTCPSARSCHGSRAAGVYCMTD